MRWRTRAAAGLVAIALVWLTCPASAVSLDPRDIWSDPQTGFAIGGFDPVAYFVNHAPEEGSRSVQLTIDDSTWLFSSRANRAVFERDPDVYAPRFGGRDPAQLAQGFETLGNPLHWVIEDDRLMLFASASSRQKWLAAGDDIKTAAEANWPALVEAAN